MKTLRAILTILIIACLTGPSAYAKRASDVKYADVERILKHKPYATPADLAKAGSDIDSVLVDMATAIKLNPELRLRAVRALAGYPGARAKSVLTVFATTLEDSIELRGEAMLSLATAFGPVVVSDLEPFLSDKDPKLRIATANALSKAGGPKAKQLLEHALPHEEVLEVRMAIDKALSGIQE
ncbi:MAG: HEAT repeat domain-containing protein [Myxococcota bacterium]|jgi:HEAT repeat protein|nr:HEAT repeat domain-containing protein [Myxococcota bacterium]HON25136.1 HEAT repeat domain-containing protein [Myxococcota bacterium]HOS61325.1 HEAT repeat domain-containing protein [Myxococcota bacterium]HPC91424.1 HEAT repeat domain-containing protein [Myxococcota bacterium]HPL24492.1 HEAT repeat domain-containing protein [Myxococcota bacterium]